MINTFLFKSDYPILQCGNLICLEFNKSDSMIKGNLETQE